MEAKLVQKIRKYYWHYARHTWNQPMFWLFFIAGPLLSAGFSLWGILFVAVLFILVPALVMSEAYLQGKLSQKRP